MVLDPTVVPLGSERSFVPSTRTVNGASGRTGAIADARSAVRTSKGPETGPLNGLAGSFCGFHSGFHRKTIGKP